VDDNVVALVPVDRGDNLVFVTQLEGIDHSDDLVKRTAGLGRVGDGEADDLLGIDHEDGSDGEGNTLRIDVGGINGIQHVVDGSDFTIGIGNDGELDVSWANFRANFVDILDPVLMRTEVVGRETNDFDISSSKVRSTTSDLSELGRANGCKVGGVGEENRPRVADPLVELDGTLCGLGFEIGAPS